MQGGGFRAARFLGPRHLCEDSGHQSGCTSLGSRRPSLHSPGWNLWTGRQGLCLPTEPALTHSVLMPTVSSLADNLLQSPRRRNGLGSQGANQTVYAAVHPESIKLGPREMAQFTECSLHKHEDLGLIPAHMHAQSQPFWQRLKPQPQAVLGNLRDVNAKDLACGCP